MDKAENDLLTRVGPGTPCGELLRRYWWPVAVSDHLTQEPQTLKLLGEEFVLFRLPDGRLVIVHVQEPPMAYGGGELPAPLPDPDSARVATMLEEVKPWRSTTLPGAHLLTKGATRRPFSCWSRSTYSVR